VDRDITLVGKERRGLPTRPQQTTMSDRIQLAQLREWMLRYADRIDQCAAWLTELDAAIGDADHGANMVRGMGNVRLRLLDSVTQPSDIGDLFRTVAMTLISSVGGAAGPLYGAFFLRAARVAGVETEIDVAQLALMFRAGVDGLRQRGKAEVGEKTMVDALEPAAAALAVAASQGDAPYTALQAARAAAEEGMKQTTGLEASKGRASYLGPRSVGHQDPGATSSFYLVECLALAVADGVVQALDV
jgi:phosphoenolpyruvate---glycerone phosphotransferase subunit DhaL